MKGKNRAKISYEPEADVLMWELTDKPIDFAQEIGNVVVHFTKERVPVLIEILDASKFLSRAESLVRKESRQSLRKPAFATR